MVGLERMPSTIPFVSIKFAARTLIASALLFPITGSGAEVEAGSVSSTVANSSLHSESPHTAFDFVNSIGLNTHLNYFDTIYGNFPVFKQELQSIGVRHLRDGVHL